MERLRKKHAKKIRYGLVGGANTLLDFVLLFILAEGLGVNKITANYISTGVSMVFSFFANKHFTFKHATGKKERQFILFIIVTVIGMWVIQPAIIWLVSHVLDDFISTQAIVLFISKLIATGASLIWNYMLYSRVVFKKHTPTEDI